MAKFWELQGSSLKIPIVEKKALDLFTLKKFVNRLGGMEAVNAERMWGKIAQQERKLWKLLHVILQPCLFLRIVFAKFFLLSRFAKKP